MMVDNHIKNAGVMEMGEVLASNKTGDKVDSSVWVGPLFPHQTVGVSMETETSQPILDEG